MKIHALRLKDVVLEEHKYVVWEGSKESYCNTVLNKLTKYINENNNFEKAVNETTKVWAIDVDCVLSYIDELEGVQDLYSDYIQEKLDKIRKYIYEEIASGE